MTQPDPPIDFTTGRILATVQDCMAKIVDSAGDLGVTLPSRQVVAPAAVPFDCAQVLAYIGQLATGAPEAGPGNRTGAMTYPNAGASSTIYSATVYLVIVRGSRSMPSGAMNETPPAPDTYLANLTAASSDTAVLLRACEVLASEQIVAAVPRTVTYTSPMGGLYAVTARIVVTA